MKTVLAVITLTTIAAFAEIKIRCSPADENIISRPDSVAAVKYVVDIDKMTGRLECAVKKDGDFCRSIRMDLSEFKKADALYACRRSQTSRSVFHFDLVQEDEFHNPVMLTITQDCRTRQIKNMIAYIRNEQSGEEPTHEYKDSVPCRKVR